MTPDFDDLSRNGEQQYSRLAQLLEGFLQGMVNMVAMPLERDKVTITLPWEYFVELEMALRFRAPIGANHFMFEDPNRQVTGFVFNGVRIQGVRPPKADWV